LIYNDYRTTGFYGPESYVQINETLQNAQGSDAKIIRRESSRDFWREPISIPDYKLYRERISKGKGGSKVYKSDAKKNATQGGDGAQGGSGEEEKDFDWSNYNCTQCGTKEDVIRKWYLSICRKCFRKNAEELEFDRGYDPLLYCGLPLEGEKDVWPPEKPEPMFGGDWRDHILEQKEEEELYRKELAERKGLPYKHPSLVGMDSDENDMDDFYGSDILADGELAGVLP